MAELFMPEQNQRTPKRESERLKTLAESLMQGGKSRGNEMVSGIVVKQSPLEHLARGLQTAAGGYFAGQSQLKAEEDERALQQRIGEALGQWGNPQEAAQILSQDPRTAEMAFKLMQGETDFARQKELMQLRAASGGGNSPAAVQIANQMFELEQAMNNPNIPEDQRFLAGRQYDLLGQAAKTYGFDRGLGYGGGMEGYSNVFGQQNIPPVQVDSMGNMHSPERGQVPNGPLNPMQYQEMLQGQDPVAAHAQAVAQQQQQIGVSPMQRPDLAQRPNPMQPFAAPQIGEVPGYTNLMAARAGQIKREEAKQAEEGKRLGEAGGTLDFLEANMPKLQEVTNRLGELSDKATYTMAGRGMDTLSRELGRPADEGAVARAEYIATVDNEVLPLLRDTFGAAFTVKEGESLRATLGDANKSPQEKKAVLNAFINQKKSQVQALQRQTGRPQQQQNPQRQQMIQTLMGAGASPDEIESYLRARGL